MRTILILCGLLTGCASSSHVARVEQPISPVQVNCAWAGKMSSDLTRVIEYPNVDYPLWRASFANLSGYQTAQQRTSSAKTILWSIRTNCRGY